MQAPEVLADAYERIRGEVHKAAEGLDGEELAFRPDAQANSIAWLLWHLTRVQDDHVAELTGHEQVWSVEGWYESFGLPLDRAAIGFGHSAEEVAAVRPDGPGILLGYHDAVTDRTLAYLAKIGGDELDHIIDQSFDPPVSVGIRLVSVIGDDLQHVGQARYVRGMVERRRPIDL